MNYNLIVNYYTDKNTDRQKELDFCFLENLKVECLNSSLVICNENDYENIKSKFSDYQNKILPIIIDNRPSYNDYFQLISKAFNDKDNINVLSNLDIIVPKETFVYSSLYLSEPNSCLALTRYDVNNIDNYSINSTFFDRVDSQDTWIFKGGVSNITGADFGLGIAGCDNSIAHLLEQAGYLVKNPSLTLKTYHYHLSNVRNYTDMVGQVIQRVPPPYKLLPTTK
jgi:hypothetical protein